jgi:DNA-binding transcriptional MerR regulator
VFKIGDFSRLGQVSVRMLRHYDELGLLKPAQVDRFTEYRYYTIEQLSRLHRILALKDLGLPLEKIAELLQQDLPAMQLQDLLRSKQADLQQQLQDTQARLQLISGRLLQLEQEGQPSVYDVVVKTIPAWTIASTRQLVPSAPEMPKYRGRMIAQLYGWLDQQHITPAGYEIILYHLLEYSETDIDMEFGVTVPESSTKKIKYDPARTTVTIRQLPAIPKAATVVHSGMLREITQAIAALFVWIGTNGYISDGAIREIHLFGKETIRVRDEPVVVEVQIPIIPL